MNRLSWAAVLLALSTAAGAQQTALTETKAIRIGLDRDLVQQRAAGNLGQAQSEVLSAGTWPNPEFSYEREALEGLDLVEQKIIVSQEFDVSGRRGLHMQAADLHLDAARYESEAWRAELIRKIRERYYEALFQQKRQTAHVETQKRIRLLNAALTRRHDEGDVQLYDYQRVITERAAIEAKVNNAAVDFNTSRLSLWALLGEGADDFQVLEGELLPLPPAALDQSSLSLNEQPALRHLQVRSEAYALQQRAESRTFPDVTLGLGWKRDEVGDRSDDGLIINASIPIPLFDRRKSNQYSYQAQSMIASSEYQLAYDAAKAELKGLWQQSAQYRQNALRYRKDAVQAVNELIEIAETYYRAGEIGIIELLDAYRSALDAELTALEFEYKARSARIKLDYLVGEAWQ